MHTYVYKYTHLPQVYANTGMYVLVCMYASILNAHL